MSIHVDDEFSVKLALEGELEDVLPGEDLADLVIARHRRSRRRRVAGAVSLVVVCAGIGVPLGLSGPTGNPPQPGPGQRPGQHAGPVTPAPGPHAVAPAVTRSPAAAFTVAAA